MPQHGWNQLSEKHKTWKSLNILQQLNSDDFMENESAQAVSLQVTCVYAAAALECVHFL